MNKLTSACLTTLLLAPLHANCALPEVPVFGKIRVGFFRTLENCNALTSNDGN